MPPKDERTIPLSKFKIVILMLGAWSFVALGIWMLTWDNPKEQLIGGLSVAFFGLCGLFAIWKLLDKKPGLILNSAGLVDNTSAVAAGMVPWSDISGLALLEIKHQQMLVISVKDPQRYIERGNAMVRAMKRANHRMCGSPVVISSHALKIDFDELQALLSQYRAKYG
jgi:hypothetical protein